ncbi:MAG: NADH-quinone oxidoreductase subunit H [bacterium]|nr:NADH-quinone oxidoreductase subunit H [bacterium]
MELALVILVKALLAFLIVMGGAAYMTWFERIVIARIQDRIGPNRVGPRGLLQPLADGVKLMLKEDVVPARADRRIHTLAPVISVACGLAGISMIPFGPPIVWNGYQIPLAVSGLSVGILVILALSSIMVYAVVLSGWSSANKYSLFGALRASAQMISYELAMGLCVVGAVIMAGSMELTTIVEAQRGLWWWYILAFPLLVIFMITALAETNRAPFDLPECESELVAGFHTEYTGMKFAMFFLAEYAAMITISALAITLFLGGYRGPLVDTYPWLGPIYLVLKLTIFMFFFVWVRGTLPRFRYDQLMAFGWKVLLPVTLVYILFLSVIFAIIGPPASPTGQPSRAQSTEVVPHA